MVRLMRRRNRRLAADRLTVGLAALAIGTAGSVLAGQFVRMTRRRTSQAPQAHSVLESAEHALGAATLATQDTVKVAVQGYSAATRRETVLFNILAGFTGAFALVRLSTWGIRHGWWPLGNVRVGGRHVHHFIPGILLAFGSGGAGLVARDERVSTTLAIPFGAGIGLTFDEAALLLQLEDVYWTPEGLLSVQVSLGSTAVLATAIIALRMLRRGEEVSEEAGLIPDETGEFAM
ncbi:MAG: hypothetical protein ACJ75R_10115 [Solirubrobacterales bacterium]